MFENLSERLSGVFDRLTKQGALSEDDVKTALREVRVALLEADVSLPVARDFVNRVQERATGQAVTKSVTPGQQVVKIVHDALVDTLSGDDDPGALKIDNPPAPILMVGLQGSGKTTTTAKLAAHYRAEGRRVLLGACDTFRAAAGEQLRTWADRVGADLVASQQGADAAAVAFDSFAAARKRGSDLLLLDTAGRLHTQSHLMEELKKVNRVLAKQREGTPEERWLVVDATLGANSLQQARLFHEAIGVTGLLVTKLDGSSRGGSLTAIYRELRLPIHFVGLGESADDLQPFRIADYAAAVFPLEAETPGQE